MEESTKAELLRQVERETFAFRQALATAHQKRARSARQDERNAVALWGRTLAGNRYLLEPPTTPAEAGRVSWLVPQRGELEQPTPAAPPNAGDAWEPPPPLEVPRAFWFAPGVKVQAAEWLTAAAAKARTSARWHRDRANGQRWRFQNLRACGTFVRWTTCRACGLDQSTKPAHVGCDVSRLCPRCSLAKAKERRARFGRARARAVLDAADAKRRYRELFLTLTVPHATRDELEAHLASVAATLDGPDHDGNSRRRARAKLLEGRALLEASRGTVSARVVALFRAWPRFARKLADHWRANGETLDGSPRAPLLPEWHRAAEWTIGDDGKGHPHFHAWLWCPFLPFELARKMWGEALAELGWPPPRTRDGLPVVDLRPIYSFDGGMAAELLKGGRRDALELSRLQLTPRANPGEDVFTYADGWTIADVLEESSPAVIGELYEALEARRLSQGSRGFFVEEPPKFCVTCLTVGELHVHFERLDDPPVPGLVLQPKEERPPP